MLLPLLAACGGGDGRPSVTFEASGTANEAYVEYGPADTESGREGMLVALPWAVTVRLEPGASFAVHVADVSDGGTVRCAVSRDETIIGSAEGEMFAACSGTLAGADAPDDATDLFTGLSDTFTADFALPREALPGGPPSLIFLGDAVGAHEIQLVDGETVEPAPLTERFPGRCPTWSPDGTRLVFGSGGTDRSLFVMDVATGGIIRVTDPATVTPDYCAAWSPDGTELAFAGAPSASPDGPTRLYIAVADGSGARPLTSSRDADLRHTHPTWAPDGSRIAFVATMPGPSDEQPFDDAIMAIAPDGTGLTLIGDPVDAVGDLAWSPTGDALLFVCRSPNVAVVRSGLCLMSADGSSQRNLTDGTYAAIARGTWSADGDAVLFVARRDERKSIFLLTLDGLLYRILDLDPAVLDAHEGFVNAYPPVEPRYDAAAPIVVALPD
ncbi:MAG: PD40 domain-containing protein [Bauldia sp.]|nr:PD40 domain-containing protein [Bauldia sp.]